MTNEQAIKWLKGLKANEILSATKEALDIAIKALETGEIYITGEDYNLYMEGYKVGKKDFEPKQGEWTDLSTDGRHTGWIACSACGQEPPNESNIRTNFCPNCGAKMRGEE